MTTSAGASQLLVGSGHEEIAEPGADVVVRAGQPLGTLPTDGHA